MNSNKLARWLVLCAILAILASCGGDDGDGGGTIIPPPPPSNQPPVATITAPAAGATFRAGDTISFAGSGTDAEDGALAAAQLTWWAELHRDTNTYPFMPLTTGESGQVTIPTQGETSANIFYRFYLSARDSAGATNVATRDILPQTVQVTVTTAPVGLVLTLDGQPITAPNIFTGVIGIERAFSAPVQQNFGGRRYQFVSWSDGGAATHTISTPATNTTFTATYTEIGPANNAPPQVALTAPADGSMATAGVVVNLSATASDSDGVVMSVEFFENDVKIGDTDRLVPYGVAWTPSTQGARTLTARATDNDGAVTTSATVTVTVTGPGGTDTQAPVATLTSPANLASGLIGTLTLSASATDNVAVTGMEFQVDGEQVGPAGSGSPHSVTVDSTRYASGQHIVRVRARDAAGNLSPWATATVEFGGNRSQPADITRTEDWVNGLSSATAFAQTPDGRMFVAQQGGQLRVVTAAGVLLATPFITLTVDPNGERGLLGVALHPGFATNRYVYLYYTTPENGTHNRISRFTANPSNPNIVSVGSELRIADLPALSSATNHNGGALHFGNDGKLYVAVGDNADSSTAPDLSNPFGKMLRFNDDGGIPGDNPFCTTANTLRCAIWARGLRNPFTFAVRPSDGRIHINDVGAGLWEEINLGVRGADYGWPSSEGPTDDVGITAPLFAYDHTASATGPAGFFNGCAITGGAFYPDSGPFPTAYRGSYYFTDFCTPVIGRIDMANGNAAYAFGRAPSSPVGMLTGLDGALYVLTQGGITRFSAP